MMFCIFNFIIFDTVNKSLIHHCDKIGHRCIGINKISLFDDRHLLYMKIICVGFIHVKTSHQNWYWMWIMYKIWTVCSFAHLLSYTIIGPLSTEHNPHLHLCYQKSAFNNSIQHNMIIITQYHCYQFKLKAFQSYAPISSNAN